jgi:phosphoribosylanthranilate isomerase
MTWIKICGTTNFEDAQTAVEAGADALGFVFYEKSPRNIDPQKAKAIVAQLPERIEKVGVFVTQSSQEIAELADQIGLTSAQLHRGEHQPTMEAELSFLAEHGLKLVEAFPAGLLDGPVVIKEGMTKHLFAVMFDSGTGFKPGGTGKKFHWRRAKGMVQHISTLVPVIVAGGLTPQNVAEAIKLFQPFGVDVVSGVEARPGKKDPDKVRAFIKAVRAADRVA